MHFLRKIINWFFVAAVWGPAEPAACVNASGACWAMIYDKYRLILFGHYPYTEQWRPLLGLVILISLIGITTMLVVTMLKIQSLMPIMISLSAFMFGIGLVLPATKAGAMQVFDKRSGLAASMMKFTQTLGCVLITLAVAQLHSGKSLLPMTLLLTASIAIALVIFIWLNARKT